MVSRLALCACGLLTCSAVFLALFVYSTATLMKYTPAYKPLSCTQLPNELGGIEMEGTWINVTGYSKKRCENPNAYPLSASEVAPGEVYAKTESGLKPIGVSNVVPIKFEAGGEDVGKTELHISLSTSDAEAMALLAQPILQVVTTIHAETSAAITFLGVSVASSEEKIKVCGFEVQMSTQKVGPTECLRMEGGNVTTIADELDIPSVDDDEIRTELVEMGHDRYESVTRKKNLAFGGIMAASGLLAIACFVGGIVAFRRARLGSKDAREAKMRFQTNAAQSAPEDQIVDAA